jgi:hypothetical protein
MNSRRRRPSVILSHVTFIDRPVAHQAGQPQRESLTGVQWR